MANIAFPFGASADRRVPTTGELATGFACGPADIELFNFLHWWDTGQIAEAISLSVETPQDNDLKQFARVVRSQRMNAASPTGTNTLTLNINPVATYAQLTYVPFRLIIPNTNTDVVTLNINGQGPKAITRLDGNPVQPGDLPSGRIIEVMYDGVAFQMLGLAIGITRDRLYANRTIYVNASTGNDANNGTVGAPFLTRQAAVNYVYRNIDLNGFVLTFNCAGAFTAGVIVNGLFIGQSDASQVIFAMGTSTVTSVAACFDAQANALITVTAGGALVSSGTGHRQGCGVISTGAQLRINNVNFGACAVAHISADCGYVSADSNYTVSGSSPNHFFASPFGTINLNNVSLLITGTPAFSNAFAYTFQGRISGPGSFFSGATTGRRYYVDGFGTIFTGGGGASYFPGTIAGAINAGQGDYR